MPENKQNIRHNALGQPTMQLRKDLISEGKYRLPDGNYLTIDHDRMMKLARKFDAMVASGTSIPLVSVDDRGRHNMKPENGRGFLRAVEVEGDRLYGILDLIGDAAMALPGKSFVSLGIKSDLKDANGNDWGEAIHHVAVTLDPVITGQKDWTIAASNPDDAGSCIYLSTPIPLAPMTAYVAPAINVKDPTMDILTHLTGMCGEAVTADNYKDMLAKHFGTASADKAKVQNLSNELAAAKADLEKAKPINLSKELKDGRSELVGAKLEALTAKGAITPAVAKKLAARFTADVLLSKTGDEPYIAAGIIEDLTGNVPVAMGKQTGGQGVDLGRTDPDEDEATAGQKKADAMALASAKRISGKD